MEVQDYDREQVIKELEKQIRLTESVNSGWVHLTIEKAKKALELLKEEETLLLYRYGTLLRPAGPGAVPREGLHAVEEGIVMPHGRPYWSIVDYERSLTEEEVKQYELEFIGCVEVKR